MEPDAKEVWLFRVVLLTSLVLMTLVPLYLVGTFLPPAGSYTGNFNRLCLALDAAYPYFEEVDVDWQALSDLYRTRVIQVETDAQYSELITEMLATLRDAHTEVLRPSARDSRIYFGMARALSDGIVVDRIGPTAQRAGLMPGDQLLTVAGNPLEETLLQLPPSLRNGSTAQHRRAVAATNILSTEGRELKITAIRPDGTTATIALIAPNPEEAIAAQGDAPEKTTRANTSLTGKRLTSGLGYIRIPTLSQHQGQDLVTEFDAALDALLDTAGLILDLRGNGGGDSRIGDRIAGRLFDRWSLYGWEAFRLRLPYRLWIKRFPYIVRPRGITYRGPVVVLIDSLCCSSAEMLAASLIDSGRAVAVGRATAGGSGNPVTFALPNDGLLRFSTGAFRRLNGQLIQGVGIEPDVAVTYTVDDYRVGRDPDIEAAEAWLLQAYR